MEDVEWYNKTIWYHTPFYPSLSMGGGGMNERNSFKHQYICLVKG